MRLIRSAAKEICLRQSTCLLTLACLLTLLPSLADAQTQCRIYLANHSDATQGFALSLEAQAGSNGVCPLSALNIVLAVGDDAANHRVTASQAWQTGVVYTAKAVIAAGGPQQLFVNGQSLGSAQGGFRPASGTLYGSQVGSTQGTQAYIVTQISLQVSNGSNSLSLPPDSNNTFPLPLILLAGLPAPWPAAFAEDPAQSTTITATFRFDALVSNPHQFDPYIDQYGQAVQGVQPSKVSADSDLQAAITEEQTWLANNGPLGGADIYGGSTLAGFTDQVTGYFHTAFRNNR
jgi:hypothetical protein